MVTHDKAFPVRHLIGQGNVAFAESLFGDVGLIQPDPVDIDGPLAVDVHPVAGGGNHAFDQNAVVEVEADDLAGFELAVVQRDHQIPVGEGVFHGVAADLQDRHQ